MATPLLQYWTDELTRIDARLAALDADIDTQRGALLAAQAARLAASDAVREQTAAVAAARKALGAIVMPADGDPLLVAMESALVALAEAQAALGDGELAVQAARAELDRWLAGQAALQAERADVLRRQGQEQQAAAARQVLADRLAAGDLATLAADAAAALTASEADARARVEGEFPSNAAAAKHLLKRSRARRAQIDQSSSAAAAVAAAALAADSSAQDQAQLAFDGAAQALRVLADALPRLAADSATLARLAALPAANPPDSYPILSRWQHDRLFDPARKAAREAALAKLTAIDAAAAALRTAQQAYDLALHAATKAQPDKTRAELDATTLAGDKATVDAKQADLATARAAMNADEQALVEDWFAAVPDRLWDELDRFDAAQSRLAALAGVPTPADTIAAVGTAEATLAAALAADRLAARARAAADGAAARAAGMAQAERETAAARAAARGRSGVAF